MTIGQDFRRVEKTARHGPVTDASFDRAGIISTVLDKLREVFGATVCTVLELPLGATHFAARPGFDDLPDTALPASLLDQVGPDGAIPGLSPTLYSSLLRAPTPDKTALILVLELPDGVQPGPHAQTALAEAGALLQLLFGKDDTHPVAAAPVRQDDARGALSRLTEAQALVVDLINEMLQARFDRIDRTIDKALAELGKFCGSDRTYLFVENDARTISNTHEWCADGIAPMKDELQNVPRDMADLWWALFDTHGHVYIEDVAALETQSELREILEMQGIISLLAVPLRIDGRAVGFMGYDSVHAHRSFLPGEIYLLKSVANVIATLLSRRADEERARAERQHREIEQRKLQATLRAMPDILLELDPDLRITGVHANPQIELPIPAENLLGFTVAQCLPQHVSALADDIKAELQAKDIAMGYRCALTVNGTQRWFSISAAKRETEDGGGLNGYVVVVRDTTESQTQRREIERLSTIARNSTNFVLITDAWGRIEWVNPAFERRTGYSLPEIQGMSPGSLLQCSLTDPDTVAQIRAALEREQAITCEILNQTKWGELYWIELAIQPMFDEQGGLTGFMSVQTDMTQHRLHARNIERALTAEKEARAQLKSAVSIMQDAFIQFDKDQKMTLCNAQFRKIFADMAHVLKPGCSLHDVLLAAVETGYCEVDADNADGWLDRELAAFHLQFSATRNMSIRGRWYRHVQQSTPDGGRISLLSDITDLKDAERRALADRARAMDASRDGIVLLNDAGLVTYANPAAVRMLGQTRGEDLARLALTDIVTLKAHGSLGDHDLHGAMQQPTWTGEVRALGADGSTVEIEISTSRNDDQGVLCILRDQTDKLRTAAEKENLREALALAQRREEMGQVAAGLTHDFNNYLAVISSAASLIEEADAHDGRALAGRINDTVEQAAGLVRRLMDLGKNRDHESVPLDLRAPVRDAVALVRPGLRPPLQLDLSLPDAPVMVMADAMSAVQVVMNLCINARDAIVGSAIDTGRIRVGMRDATPGDLGLPFQIGAPDAESRYACVTIDDNGPGMPAEVLENVFTPYFSTKGDKGTGLGLQIVVSALQAHSAALSLDSAPGRGTRFTILWPVMHDLEQDTGTGVRAGLDGKSILILGTGQDNERILASALEAAGALAVPCVERDEALAVLDEDPDSWDAVIFERSYMHAVGEFDSPHRRGNGSGPALLCWMQRDAPYSDRITADRLGVHCVDLSQGADEVLSVLETVLDGR
ncbi:MAG: PAS domain-containing protein [Alphaproteobacteria bacterium]|jgi:PAS domain S-box-containing protein|nr:PAS domain-containing protein [Alphaproteobacteria bacterium]